ncbi:MAG: SHOCT domain-containing protein [Deltaproteobacteria bacterium]|nr:SHOCT domain-containing protein [Deltaproteobacteria bacterium]
MKEPRKIGLALIFLGVVILLGNTTEALPPEAFFAGVVLYPIGGYLFFKGSREAIQQAEARAARIRAPRLKNETAEKFAGRQKSNIEANGSVDAQVHATAGAPESPTQPANDDITDRLQGNTGPMPPESNAVSTSGVAASEATNSDFNVSPDVSFPVEVQQHDSLADQIMKLQKLKEGGIISDEEMAVAKAKLLG